MKKLISLLLLAVVIVSLLSLSSCSDGEEFPPYEFADKYEFDPYGTLFKDNITPAKNTVSVKGKTFIFSDIQVRENDASLDVASVHALEELYAGVMIEFFEEDELQFIDYSLFFPIPRQKVERRGNLLQFENTNKTGDITYTVRVEIYDDCIWVVHNAHHFYDEGKYSLIKFVDVESLDSED